MIKRYFLFCLLAFLGASCRKPVSHDMVITNASVFNARTGEEEQNRTILVDNGIITDVLQDASQAVGDTVIDAAGRLVTPGFIDAVGHLDDIFGDSVNAMTMDTGLFEAYRTSFSDTYLPYGVMAVRNAGDCEDWLPAGIFFMKNSVSNAPDLYTSGGSLTFDYDGPAYINHVKIKDSAEAAEKVRSYYEQGIRHIKAMGNIQYYNLKGILPEVNKRGMIFTIQAQFMTSIDSCLSLGITRFEHASTVCYDPSVFDFLGDTAFLAQLSRNWSTPAGEMPAEGNRIYPYMEAANYLGPHNTRVEALIKKMAGKNASMSTSLHFFAQWFGLTYYTSKPKAKRFVTTGFSEEQKKRCVSGYRILAGYVKQMHDSGVMLAIGTDHVEGGKAVLSDMLLLHDAGIPMKDVLQIATLNTARYIGKESVYGSIEKGKRANLILFDKNPLNDPKNLLERKTVIKDGVVVKP
jgi:imidazolonepropionase-like amidohydrolase